MSLSHSTCTSPGGGGYGMAVSIVPPWDCGLEDAGGADSRPTYIPGRDRPSWTHPSGVLQRLWTRGRRSVARSIMLREGFGVAPPLADRNRRHHRLIHKQRGDDHQLQPGTCCDVLHKPSLLVAYLMPGWMRLNQGLTTPRPSPGAQRKPWQSMRWLWAFSIYMLSTQGSSSSTLLLFIDQASKIAWNMTHLAFLIFLTIPLSPTCLLPIPSRTVHGRYPSRRRICFITWYPLCAGIRASRNYTRCSPAEALQAVEWLLCHPSNQSCSPRSIRPSYWTPQSLWAPHQKYPVLQAPSGPTW